MGGQPIPSASSAKVDSNFQCLLNSLTPYVPLNPIPEVSGPECTHLDYFMLRDVWRCYEECSSYGQGTMVVLENGDQVIQYFTPYVSAIHILTNKKIPKEDSGSENIAAASVTGKSKSDELLKSSTNSTESEYWDSSLGVSSTDHEQMGAFLFKTNFKFHDSHNPYKRAPLFEKIQELAKENPSLMTLRSSELLPTSWMAVAWYPIYHIPCKGVVKDLSAAFITFHTLSSLPQDTGVDPAQRKKGGSKTVIDKKKSSNDHPRTMPLRPFAMAALNLKGDVWFIKGESDRKRYIDLNKAAYSWLNQRHFFHHDFNHFSRREHIQGR